MQTRKVVSAMFLYDLVPSTRLHPLAVRTSGSDMTSPAIVSFAIPGIEGIDALPGAHGGWRVAGASAECHVVNPTPTRTRQVG
jgi:hypothetical protein